MTLFRKFFVALAVLLGLSTFAVTEWDVPGQVPPVGQAFCSSIGYFVVRTTGRWVCSNSVQKNVTWWGADPTGKRDSTAAINTVLTLGGDVFLPAGTYNISSNLVYSATLPTCMKGSGVGVTTLNQTSTSSDTIDVPYTTLLPVGGCLRDLRIKASTTSSGAAVTVHFANNGWTIENVWISDHANALIYQDSWNTANRSIWITNFTNTGVWMQSPSSGLGTGLGVFDNILIQNVSPVGTGIQVDSDGGTTFSNVTVLGVGTGMNLQPVSGKYVYATNLINFYTEVDSGPGLSINSTVAPVIDLHIIDGGFSECAIGILMSGNGTSLVRIINPKVRINQFQGIDILGGNDILIMGGEIVNNSQSSSMSYPGIEAAANNVSHVQIIGNFIGNLPAVTTNQYQGYPVVFDGVGGSNYYIVQGNDTVTSGLAGVQNVNTGSTVSIVNNLP